MKIFRIVYLIFFSLSCTVIYGCSQESSQQSKILTLIPQYIAFYVNQVEIQNVETKQSVVLQILNVNEGWVLPQLYNYPIDQEKLRHLWGILFSDDIRTKQYSLKSTDKLSLYLTYTLRDAQQSILTTLNMYKTQDHKCLFSKDNITYTLYQGVTCPNARNQDWLKDFTPEINFKDLRHVDWEITEEKIVYKFNWDRKKKKWIEQSSQDNAPTENTLIEFSKRLEFYLQQLISTYDELTPEDVLPQKTFFAQTPKLISKLTLHSKTNPAFVLNCYLLKQKYWIEVDPSNNSNPWIYQVPDYVGLRFKMGE